jgi:methionyl-tRNA formyltransferase
MQLIMMGTGPFAVPLFRALYETRHRVAALVTAPLRSHRGQPVAPISSIRDVAREHGTPIVEPEDVNSPEAQSRLAQYHAGLLVVCDYGQILSPATLATTGRGGVNLHASLLPKYRGAAPINWAIYNGENETGVTVLEITPRIDAGGCLAQTRVAIGPEETAAELEVRLAQLGARLTCETIDRLESGDIRAIPQDAVLVTKAPRLKKTDGAIDWSRPALAIKNQIRALEPWPKTYTFWHRPDGPPVRLILGPVSVLWCRRPACQAPGGTSAPQENTAVGVAVELPPQRESIPAPGTVLEASADRLVIAAGKDAVMPTSIQPSGKRLLPIAEFLRGYHVRLGDRLGEEASPEGAKLESPGQRPGDRGDAPRDSRPNGP